MKYYSTLLLLLVFTLSCKKNEDSLIDQYKSVAGTWTTSSISYDSSGIRVIRITPYDKLVILENLDYQLFYKSVNQVEQGKVDIISQSRDKLELYFKAVYPVYSSFAGSHIFGGSILELVSVSASEMVLKASENSYNPGTTFNFKR